MKTLLATLALATIAAAPPPAAKLSVGKTVDIAASPQKVWHTIGGFCGIADWHPVIEKCVLKAGAKPQRTLSLKGGGTIVETQVSRDDRRMRYTYAIVSGPLPVAHYLSTIAVVPKGKGSAVTWSGKFDAAGASDDAARGAIAGVYSSGLDGLAAKLR